MNAKPTTIRWQQDGRVGTITLNRPEVRNAFNDVMIHELTECFQAAAAMDDLSVIILQGEGSTFCSGADLNWMREAAGWDFAQNLADSQRLAECFHAIYRCPKATLARVRGAAIGGANGLIAACDFAFCETDALFSLSEVKIGIVPACIGPYVLKRVGEFPARSLMLSGERIRGEEAARLGLVNRCLPAEELDAAVQRQVELLLTGGPAALKLCKEMIGQLVDGMSFSEAREYTARLIAEIRMTPEAQEGMQAFLERRKPDWVR